MITWSFIIYGILLALGGIWGFVKARSTASLIMGIFSSLLIFAGVGVFTFGHYAAGSLMLLLTSIFLVVVFAVRLAKTRKFMPSGMLLVLSLAAFALALQSYLQVK